MPFLDKNNQLNLLKINSDGEKLRCQLFGRKSRGGSATSETTMAI
jgi:hypothetical protein